MKADRSLINQLIEWSLQPRVVGGMILSGIALASALTVVAVAHGNRQIYAQLQSLQYERDRLDSDFEKLLLEQSAWTEYSRVEDLSTSKLLMRRVSPDVTVVVRGEGKLL